MTTAVDERAEAMPCGTGVGLTLAAVPTAVSCARAFTRDTLRGWSLAHLVESAELVTSELVTNAVPPAVERKPWLAADDVPVIQVHLVHSATSLFIGVADGMSGQPVLQEPDSDSETGRGLFMVAATAERWGWCPLDSGRKMVWCQLGCPPATMDGHRIDVPAQRREFIALLHRVLHRLRRLQSSKWVDGVMQLDDGARPRIRDRRSGDIPRPDGGQVTDNPSRKTRR